MLICEVIGTVVATAKKEGFRGSKLLLVKQRTASGDLVGEAFVATDTIGAGRGEVVLVAVGAAARSAEASKDVPTDAAIVAIVDAVEDSSRPPGEGAE